MSKPKLEMIGFMVVMDINTYENVKLLFWLEFPDDAPPEGILMPTWERQQPTVFTSRKDARDAIKRTHHWNALWCDDHHATVGMRIVGVKRATYGETET